MAEKIPLGKIVRRTILGLVALGIVVIVIVNNQRVQRPSLPVYGTIPEFSLTAADGNVVNRDNLTGNVVVADFIFTRCAGTCPIMSTQMKQVQDAIDGQSHVKLVSITVDPDHDTPEVLQKYALQYGAHPNRWIFLTGEKQSIQNLSQKGFHLGVAEGSGSAAEPIIHSTKFVLLDRQTRIRGYYDGTEEEGVKQLVADLKHLLAER